MQKSLCILYTWRKLFRFIFVCNKNQIVILNLFIKMVNGLYQQISYRSVLPYMKLNKNWKVSTLKILNTIVT